MSSRVQCRPQFWTVSTFIRTRRGRTGVLHDIPTLSSCSCITCRQLRTRCGMQGSVLRCICGLISSVLLFGWEISGLGAYWRTGVDFSLQGGMLRENTWYNDYSIRSGEPTGYFMIISGCEAPDVFVCDSFLNCVLYLTENPETLMNTLVMREMTIPPNSIFIEHVYIQDAEDGWKETHSLRYHIYCKPETYYLPDAIISSYGWSMGLDAQNELEL